jgi:hypothetical protein
MTFLDVPLPSAPKEGRTKNVGQAIMDLDSKRSKFMWRFMSQRRIFKNFSIENLLLAYPFKAILTKGKENHTFAMDR